MATVKVLGVHGVGRHPQGGAWEQTWREPIVAAVGQMDPGLEVEVVFCHYDDIFERHDLSFLGTIEALGKLAASAIAAPFRGTRGIGGSLRWTAGMVVQWVENEALRDETRKRLAAAIEEHKPDVVCAHSLGSLVAYDTFTAGETKGLAKGRIFVSFGSQIGNPFVAGNFLAGRIEPLGDARHWYHLYNRHDSVFAAPIRLPADNFDQIDTEFDEPGIADHSAHRYLGHPRTRETVWGRVVAERAQPGIFRAMAAKERARAPKWAQRRPNRALLVGINDYPDPAMRLEGCENDVFLMSSLLQETAVVQADDIRIVLNDRATAQGIRERMDWLLEDARAGDVRVLYYSGHGAKMPTYGMGDLVDRSDESLVPHDFDWSPERAITDDQFHALYSQLPYEMVFVAVFDCCHSGGLTRDGRARIRGIEPPDDIRHRSLRWDPGTEMWLPRKLVPPDEEFAARQAPSDAARAAAATHRLGHGACLRTLGRGEYLRRRESRGHSGPYLPLLQYACQEDEYAYEYPLTVVDGFSRYLLGCQGLHSPSHEPSRAVFLRLFREYGLPRVIRTDNGAPFATTALGRLSRLSVWWIRLGIYPELIEPAHPEQKRAPRAHAPDAEGEGDASSAGQPRRAAAALQRLRDGVQRAAPARGHRPAHAGRALPTLAAGTRSAAADRVPGPLRDPPRQSKRGNPLEQSLGQRQPRPGRPARRTRAH